ncbi:palmitoyltransferase ZDHHC4-like [Physella acuta]|uniref:palmitoyltransferase ZDHHC4-like n=1 Tax=Physella acuta TaxID=109671 RepID=UPI0027DBBCCC|nr:palmitoyltransferase ZDHHC4-like [Physella acuta]
MDFLIFLLGYVGLFVVVAVLAIISSSSSYLSQLSEKFKCFFLKVIYAVVPGFIIRLVSYSVDYVFNTRNHVMQLVFGLLVLGGNFILILDVLPLLYIFEPETNHILLPLVLLFTNAAAFHLSCTANPGHITPSNAAIYASLYKADGTMYTTGVECQTCRLVKPARSKHCRVCNRCVHRFDHHCIWTNNCVGAGNLRYFISFLLSLLMMLVNGAVMSTRAMVLLVQHFKLMETGYVDSFTGQMHPVTLPILIQHLFMQHPRCIFLITSLLMLMVLLGMFTLYHLYLLLNNQTTNERYKMASLQSNTSQQPRTHQVNKTAASLTADHNFNNTLTKNQELASAGSFYDKGIWSNIKEVFFPWSDLQIKKRNTASNFGHNKSKRKVC